jgi:hypothetical protein
MEWDAEVSQGGDSFLDDGNSSSADDVVYQNLVIVEDPSSRLLVCLWSTKTNLGCGITWHQPQTSPNRRQEEGSEF